MHVANMKRIVTFFLIVLFVLTPVFMQAEGIKDPNLRDVRGISRLNAFNVKMMPAFYWDCVGIEAEYPLTEALTLGFNALVRYGRTDNGINVNFKIRPEQFQDPGARIEFAIKYYFPYSKKVGYNAPIGLYVQANVAFMHQNNLFFDGNSRPYTFNSRWKDTKDDDGIVQTRVPTSLDSPRNLSLGIGVGYQVIVIPNHIIANIMLGTNGYLTQPGAIRNGAYLGFYASPSIGFVF